MNNIVPHVLCVVSVGLASAACSSDDKQASSTKPPPDSTVAASVPSTEGGSNFSISIGEPASLDPALSQELEGTQVTRLLFQTLVTLSPDLEVTPGVATEWSVGADQVTWTFKLADDKTFSDGRPVVADDFVFAFARAADPDLASPSAYQGLPIKGWAEVNSGDPSGAIADSPVSGVTAVDEHTLTIETESPFSLLPKVLTYPIFAPIAPEYVDTADAAATFGERPIGNGPYMMTDAWEHNVGINLEKNPNFAGTAGVTDSIEFRIYSDIETSFRDFEAGNLDIARNIPPDQIAAARETFGDRFVSTQTASLSYIGFPTKVPPFDNPDIRAALSLAIDRDALAERIYSGSQVPAGGMVPPQVPGAMKGKCDACVYDPVRAKELFDKAGGIPGNSMVVYDISDDGQQNLEPILSSWRDLFGLDIEVRSFEFAQYLEETAVGKPVGPFELGWVWDYPSGYSILSPLFESTSTVNTFGWSNPEFDALLESVRTSPNEESGLSFLTKAQEIVQTEMPIAPITFINDLGVVSKRLSGVKVDAGSLWRLELVEVNS